METFLDSGKILTSTPKEHTKAKAFLDRPERTTLQTLQPSASGEKLNGGKDIVRQQNDCISEGKLKARISHEESLVIKSTNSSSQTVKIYEDPVISSASLTVRCSRLTQTDDSLLDDLIQDRLQQNASDPDDSGRISGYFDQAYDLMVKGEPSENYWKDVAEERRRALKETLAENEKLSSENEELREENARLSKIAAQAEALKELLEGVISDDEGIEQHDSYDANASETSVGAADELTEMPCTSVSQPGIAESVDCQGDKKSTESKKDSTALEREEDEVRRQDTKEKRT